MGFCRVTGIRGRPCGQAARGVVCRWGGRDLRRSRRWWPAACCRPCTPWTWPACGVRNW